MAAFARRALELCCNRFRVHTLDSPLRPTCLVFRVRDEQLQLRFFLRAQSAQQQRQGRRVFLLSVFGHAATAQFQLATEAAFQSSSVRHTTKVSTPDWPVSRRFIFQHRLLASRLNKSLYVIGYQIIWQRALTKIVGCHVAVSIRAWW